MGMRWTRREGKLVNANVLGYNVVEFTRHALEQMTRRIITEEQVLETLRNPDETGLPTQEGRHRVRRSISRYRYVDVVYIEQRNLVVVTVISVQKDRPRPLRTRRKK